MKAHINSPMDRLHEKSRRHGLKLTKQRETICEVFFAQEGHRRAEEILQDARALDAKVSLATVYRTLKLLQEYGLAKSHNFQDGQALFEPCLDNDHHDHLICTNCGRIVEFVNQEIEDLQLRIASAHGFYITNHKMELYGLCSSCKK
jgi:Fur family transcriptional regulator, ferric uptake regulator